MLRVFFLLIILSFNLKALAASSDACLTVVKTIKEHHLLLEKMDRGHLILPAFLDKRWKLAKKIKFPFGKIEYLRRNNIGVGDVKLLRGISEKNILGQSSLPLGAQIKMGGTSVIIEGVIEAGEETKEVILNIEGRKYWVELPVKEKVALSIPGGGPTEVPREKVMSLSLEVLQYGKRRIQGDKHGSMALMVSGVLLLLARGDYLLEWMMSAFAILGRAGKMRIQGWFGAGIQEKQCTLRKQRSFVRRGEDNCLLKKCLKI